MRIKKVGYSPRSLYQGFTLVELVVVLVLVAILGVYATVRFGGTQGYAEFTFRDRLISALRTVQTRAMQDTALNNTYQINLNINSDPDPEDDTNDFAFGPPDATDPFITFAVPHLSGNGANEIAGESVTLLVTGLTPEEDTPQLFVVRFNGLGEPIDASGAAICINQCQIDFIGQGTASVCIEPLGYIHQGACQL